MAANEPTGRVVLFCRDLEAGQAFFSGLGFRLTTIFPADAPRQLELVGFGLVLCLQRSSVDGGGHLRLPGPRAPVATAPNGARIEFGPGTPALEHHAIDAAFAVHHAGGDDSWHLGRAGMLYRDLLPDRLGGAVVASHIRIARGGPVPDYVHFHRLHAQALYVLAGQVRVVYEDQGEPFAMHAGDCVLQPPEIRHRVLECSDGFEVVEVATPAEHVTAVDHEHALPSATVQPARRFAGQCFHHHVAATATAQPAAGAFARVRDCGLRSASAGAIAVQVFTGPHLATSRIVAASRDVRLWFPVRGALRVQDQPVHAGDACVLPPDEAFAVRVESDDVELLEFALPRAH